MKFLVTYEADPSKGPPDPATLAALGKLTEEMMKAGVVLMTGGLIRPTRGTKIRCTGGHITVTDGPFAETKELIDGFALLEVKSKAEAIEMSSRFMKIAGDGTGEILQVFEPMEMPPR